MALCLIGAGETVRIAVTVFSLSWIHTVEKIPWQETWLVEPDALVLAQARIKGSGAGMEPPDDAKLIDGWYVWAPASPRRSEVVLRNRAGIDDWRLCAENIACLPVHEILGRQTDRITLKACP